MHRLVNKTPDNLETDHINGDRLDNRRKNLRSVTASINQLNRRKRDVGVHYSKNRGKWMAYIMVNRRRKFLGYWNSKELAMLARKSYEVSI